MSKQISPIDELKHSVTAMTTQIQAALPPHIPAERFVRVVLTAISTNQALAQANRQSFFAAAMKSAQDGLLPDGREAALVTYKSKEGIVTVSYQPMVSGIMKKGRNSGEIGPWSVQVVKENDNFDYEMGDNEFIKHKPALFNRGKTIGAYSIVTFKDGTKSRDWMNVDEINAIRARSRSGNSGPWATDYDEMCKKTVIKRHAKRLPTSSDLDDMLRVDNDVIDLDPKPEPIAAHNEPAAQPQQEKPVEAKKSRVEKIVEQAASGPTGMAGSPAGVIPNMAPQSGPPPAPPMPDHPPAGPDENGEIPI